MKWLLPDVPLTTALPWVCVLGLSFFANWMTPATRVLGAVLLTWWLVIGVRAVVRPK